MFDYKAYVDSIGCEIVSVFEKYIVVSDGQFQFKLFKNRIRNDSVKPNLRNCLEKTEYFKSLMSNINKDLIFDNFIFNGVKIPSVVKCVEHGEFYADPYRLLRGSSCSKCYNEKIKPTVRRKSKDVFIEESKLRFGESFSYDKVVYVNTMTKVTITCNTHGDFLTTPNEHLKATFSCPTCYSENHGGYSRSDYAKTCRSASELYVFKLKYDGEIFYKIGISKNPMKRLKSIKSLGVELISGDSFKFDIPEVVWDLEKYFHKVFKESRFQHSLGFSGYTECFRYVNMNIIYDEINLYRRM